MDSGGINDHRTSAKSFIRRIMRALGFDVIRYPIGEWVYLRELFRPMFNSLRINLVLDVGANCGAYGTFLRKIGYTGEIVSFEPVSSTFAALKQTCAGDPHWRACSFALGNQDAQLPIRVAQGTDFSSFLKPNAFGSEQFPQSASTRTEIVWVRRLDSVLGEYVGGIPEPRIFLKIDAQGYDLQVLEGAAGCLNCILAMQTEISVLPIYEGAPDYHTALGQMKRFGFDIAGLFPVSQDQAFRVIEFDCVMVRSSGPSLERLKSR
jgi:FkbM family methyltransferase